MNNSALLDLCQKKSYETDKFSTKKTPAKHSYGNHSYIEYAYGNLFERIRSAKNVLEIGIWNGESHLLWQDYFPNAQIVGIDVNYCGAIENQPRITQLQKDAYCLETSNSFEDGKFDLIIDDGPHTFYSMKFFIQNYLPKVSKKGILCIEDISAYNWLYELSSLVPISMRECIKIYDLREKDNKNDSILMVIDKGALNG